jgi:hypothetical protein
MYDQNTKSCNHKAATQWRAAADLVIVHTNEILKNRKEIKIMSEAKLRKQNQN